MKFVKSCFLKFFRIFTRNRKAMGMGIHFVVYWTLPRGQEGDFSRSILDKITHYTHVKVLPNLYVIRVNELMQYNNLTKALQHMVGNTNCIMLITPPMKGGVYNGNLEPEIWQKINSISQY